MTARIIVCACCGRERPNAKDGWCNACWMRWDRAGRPESGPPPVRQVNRPLTVRVEDYLWLRGNGMEGRESIALAMGVSVAAVRVYEKAAA